MLEDLSQHILDIAENSTRARASTVTILVEEYRKDGWLNLTVMDDGDGMDDETCAKALDPFHTTRTTRRVGLGLPFLKQLSELCGGTFSIQSKPGLGTTIKSSFLYNSIDRPPLGNIPATIMTLLLEAPTVHWVYHHMVEDREFCLDSDELLEILGDKDAFTSPSVALWIKEYVSENILALNSTESHEEE